MKKVVLSAIVILSFFSYAWYLRVKAASQTQVTSPVVGETRVSQVPTDMPPTPTSSLTQPTIGIQQIPTQVPVIPTATPKSASGYKDGTFTGSVADAFYGNIQVQVSISGGRINNIQFLQYPNDRSESIQINQQADPILAQEAIQAQSANVDIVSGATDSSQAFIDSMQAALSQAKS